MSIVFSKNVRKHDGLIPAWTHRDHLQRAAHLFRNKVQIVLGLVGEIVPTSSSADVPLPAGKFRENRPAFLEYLQIGGKTIQSLAAIVNPMQTFMDSNASNTSRRVTAKPVKPLMWTA